MRHTLMRGRTWVMAAMALLLSILSLLPAGLTRAWADDSVKGKTFVIATDTTFAPFEYRDSSGNMTGIDMDLLREIAKREGFTVQIKSIGFDAALQAVQSRQADGVIAGMSITDARKQIFDFSAPYFDSGVQMAVKSDSTIKSYADLKGKTVVAKTGAEGLSFAQSIAGKYGFTVKALDKADTMYSEVQTGNAAAVFDDYPVLAYGIAQGNGLKVVTPKEQGASYGFAVLKGQNAALLSAFNAGLAAMKSDGSYQATLDKYLKAPDTQSTAKQSFWGLLVESFPALMKGLAMTLAATALSLFFASVLGIAFGFCKVSGVRILQILAAIYVDIFRGTPILVQAFFFYFGLPAATGVKMGVFTAGVLTLSLNAGAYMTEIVRGGIRSVDPGQMEASRSLGLTWLQSMRRVIVPQAIKIATPSVINQFVISLKDTSLLAVLGFAELTYQGQQIIARNFKSFQIWLMVGAIYFIVIFALTKLSNSIDRRFNK
ncbi:amino acid ABC transporter substrate-binding protein/permease [Acidipropionibacterium timonense]|uniref:amino acid ABC transporter substrate-binding protein/permease n=1 Tax=Acidipropionibacterium timonense TaxID=2161818 RepID=UPI00102FD406|nr:amino acid ABC transporter substrate-binding protein/permease [Acidipropionibacterium timonense]